MRDVICSQCGFSNRVGLLSKRSIRCRWCGSEVRRGVFKTVAEKATPAAVALSELFLGERKETEDD